jgi:hypothetical protein
MREDIQIGRAKHARVQRVQRVPPYILCPRLRVERWYAVPKGDGPCGPKVLKVLRFDSGLWPLRVVVSPLRGNEYIVSVTGFALVSPVLHDGE